MAEEGSVTVKYCIALPHPQMHRPWYLGIDMNWLRLAPTVRANAAHVRWRSRDQSSDSRIFWKVGVESTNLISNSNIWVWFKIIGPYWPSLKTRKTWMVQLKMTTLWVHAPSLGHNRLFLFIADHDCDHARSNDFHCRKALRSYAHSLLALYFFGISALKVGSKIPA
jgi:hypothetical protein